ncbi:hypothetical protein MTO96_008914 [Rhipicephalus appendiculatus]
MAEAQQQQQLAAGYHLGAYAGYNGYRFADQINSTSHELRHFPLAVGTNNNSSNCDINGRTAVGISDACAASAYADRGNMAVPAQSGDVVSNGRPADHQTATEAHSTAVAAATRERALIARSTRTLCSRQVHKLCERGKW